MRRALLPLLLLALALAACDGKARVHTFVARFWDAGQGCLEAAAVIDVLEGSDPGTCPRTQCWLSPAGDAYVTTEACDAPLDFRDATHDPQALLCVDALEALAAGDESTCGSGG